eukprot:Blabericola_migrator_1__183@NODE_104_length_14270_cov_182_757446_g92_i0_p14_GENE_NODE_104_length_14270_cov_182_757446_g92_i0NODE_104_length_14270_cov_182_757446_g92_i0_p14_ORF_typecomplete_len110_score8_38_NODE_104_length_14270_cov_182_757446_g92_i01130811637
MRRPIIGSHFVEVRAEEVFLSLGVIEQLARPLHPAQQDVGERSVTKESTCNSCRVGEVNEVIYMLPQRLVLDPEEGASITISKHSTPRDLRHPHCALEASYLTDLFWWV